LDITIDVELFEHYQGSFTLGAKTQYVAAFCQNDATYCVFAL